MTVAASILSVGIGNQLLGAVFIILVAAVVSGAIAMLVNLVTKRRS
jgi:hypothetical protein